MNCPHKCLCVEKAFAFSNNTLNKAESISLSKVKGITEIQHEPQELCLYQAGNAYGNEIKHQQKKN